jgi:hypothetical protein
MSNALLDLMVDIASDPDRVARFVEDPARELEGVDLSPRERAAVLSGSQFRILLELKKSVAHLMTFISFKHKFKKKKTAVAKKKATRTVKKPAARRRK